MFNNTYKWIIRVPWSLKFLMYQRGDMFCFKETNEYVNFQKLVGLQNAETIQHLRVVHIIVYVWTHTCLSSV